MIDVAFLNFGGYSAAWKNLSGTDTNIIVGSIEAG
jgi:hypothetical protein